MIPVDVLALLFVEPPTTAVLPPIVVVSPPVSPVITRTGGVPGVLKIDWTAGDSAAYTRIYIGPDSGFYPYITLNPAVITWTSDIAANQSYSVDLTHTKDGKESTMANATWAGTG